MNRGSGFKLFLREQLIDEAIDNIEKGVSSKVLAAPRMGTTSFLKTIYSLFNPKGLHNDKGYSFYFSHEYDFSSFRHSIDQQMQALGYGSYKIDNDNLLLVCNQIANLLVPPTSPKKIIFLFDNFQDHCSKSMENNNTKDTILTHFNLNKIRSINNHQNPKIVFFVTYRYPIETYLGTDWYLNNLSTIELGLLDSSKEVDKIIQFVCQKSISDILPKNYNKIKFYGGRHPCMLFQAARTNFENQKETKKLINWLNRRYEEIEKYLNKHNLDAKRQTEHIECLRNIGKNRITGDIQCCYIPEQYCYKENSKRILCSEHFKEYLLKDQNSLINAISKIKRTDMDGITLVKESKNCKGDVIFVHGLDGDARDTWQQKKKPDTFWPLWLGEELPQINVWTLGYKASSISWKGSTMPLSDRATNTLALLDVQEIGKRPIIFICHSLGGLLVKQILRLAKDFGDSNWEQIAINTKGIVFLSTPHSGSDIATWFNYIGKILRSTVSVDELKAHDPYLRQLNIWYRNFAQSLNIQTQVYCEKKKISGVLVVNETTADPGMQGVIPIPMDENHVSISKPNSKKHLIFSRTKKFIQDTFNRL